MRLDAPLPTDRNAPSPIANWSSEMNGWSLVNFSDREIPTEIVPPTPGSGITVRSAGVIDSTGTPASATCCIKTSVALGEGTSPRLP